jgi:hypothetical protein
LTSQVVVHADSPKRRGLIKEKMAWICAPPVRFRWRR